MDRSKSSSIPTLLHQGQELTTSRTKAEALNQAFAAKACSDDQGRAPPLLATATIARLRRVNTRSREVRRLLLGLKTNTASGSDGIGARVLRECATELAPS
jgi:hypothetical protein